jgi:hypothetical protein
MFRLCVQLSGLAQRPPAARRVRDSPGDGLRINDSPQSSKIDLIQAVLRKVCALKG